MAIYHLHAKIVQRSKGKNVVAAAAYRRATDLFDEREQRHWNYTNKPDVVHSELLIPDNAPAWVKDFIALHHVDPSKAAEKLWNSVDAAEKRVDSQLARDIEFALPIELDLKQNSQLAREFITDQFVLRGMIADWNIHWDAGNPHVHVMLTMRELMEEGFGKRVLEWNNKALLQEWRAKWAEYANFHLRLHLHDVAIDHRSYEAQGIDLIPSIHQGKAVTDMSQRGITTNIMIEANDIRRENLSRICAKPTILLNKMSAQASTFTPQQLGHELGRYINDQGHFSSVEKNYLTQNALATMEAFQNELHTQTTLTPDMIAHLLMTIEHHDSVFTEKTLAKAIQPYTNNADQFTKALLQIKTSPELLYLGPGEDGRDRFTTKRMFALENAIQRVGDKLGDTVHIAISSQQIKKIVEQQQSERGKLLTEEQSRAIQHILKPASISCMVGRAGTGKSFTLGMARGVWEGQGLRVLGVALSGMAADGLAKEAGIVSRTIDSFRFAIDHKQIALTHRDVIVMDEAGMTDSVSMLAVLKAVQRTRAKLVLVGDPAQLQPVGPGASFRALIERLGFTEIQTVYRQKEQWQRDATVDFSAGRIKEGLITYDTKDCVHLEKNAVEAQSHLVKDWLATRDAYSSSDINHYLVIAHRNDDVAKLNEQLRAARVMRSEITEGYEIKTKNGVMKIAIGDRLLFRKKDPELGINNGRFATIKHVAFTESGKVTHFTVMLDGTAKEVTINPQHYRDFAYGYAATVHKTQGATVDHTFVYAEGAFWNRHLIYVAMSRHRENCHLYSHEEAYSNKTQLIKQLGRVGIKDSLLDFPLAFAERRGINTNSLLQLLPKHLTERLISWREQLTTRYAAWIDPEGHAQRLEKTAQQEANTATKLQRREDARLIAAYADANIQVGKAWQAMQLKLNALGLSKINYNDASFASISCTPEYLVLQTTLQQRNHTASVIMQNPNRYQFAIELYNLELTQLQKQADQYKHHSFKTSLAEEREKVNSASVDTTEITPLSFENVLIRFVELELEQTRLVHAMYEMRGTDKEKAHAYSIEAIQHSKATHTFASKALQHPDIKSRMENLAITKPPSLVERGGLSAIHERMKKGDWQQKDIDVVILQLRKKALEQSRTEMRDRDKGGRSH